MTDERIWELSSVAERCEILRRRMDAKEQTQRVKRWSDLMQREVAEKMRAHQKTKQSDADYELAFKIERWKRIEAAAHELVMDRTWPEKRADDCARLREALRS